MWILFIVVNIAAIIIRNILNKMKKVEDPKVKLLETLGSVLIGSSIIITSYLVTDTLKGFIITFLFCLSYFLWMKLTNLKTTKDYIITLCIMPIMIVILILTFSNIIYDTSFIFMMILLPNAILFGKSEPFDMRRFGFLFTVIIIFGLMLRIPHPLFDLNNSSPQDRLALEYLKETTDIDEWFVYSEDITRGQSSIVRAWNIDHDEYITLVYKNSKISIAELKK